jgi:GT2 family glycosyltransferase
MINSKKSIAVLLTCFNRREQTLACLNSLFELMMPVAYNLEVFLVDDGSTDGTSNLVAQKFPEVHLIQGTGSLYWNRGMHLAWKTAIESKPDFDFFLWLNDDVKLKKNSLEVLLNDFNQKPNGIICGVMASENTSKITYGGRDQKEVLLKPNGEIPQECYSINGNFVLVSKEVYDKVGMLDPIFPHAIGDFDYGLRALKKGIKSYISSTVVGFCESNPKLPVWCRPEIDFRKRLKSLYSPLGNAHPIYYFKYELRHMGVLTAIKHYITLHLRLIAPGLWK